MRTVVALVEARPETIAEDYRRVLNLAGLAGLAGTVAENAPRLLVAAEREGFEPGWACTPWQLDGTLTWLGERARGAEVLAVGRGGAAPLPPDPIWHDSLARHAAAAADASVLRRHRHPSGLLHPALDTILSAGIQVPVGLALGPALLLAAPALRPGWGVAGAAAQLRTLVTEGAATGRRAPAAEITAEAVGVAREMMPELGIVLDGTIWGVTEGRAGRKCVTRNVLLAGADPVAVDAVALRLAGIDPLKVPWLRICVDRGFGFGRPADIRIAGNADLLDLDFGLRGNTFAADRDHRWPALGSWLGRGFRRAARRDVAAALSGTGWDHLHDEYAAGARHRRQA